jgi:hypothetical protein
VALRGFREWEIEHLRGLANVQTSPLAGRAISRLVKLHDEARLLRSLLQEERVPQELAKRLQEAKQERGELFATDVIRLTIDCLFLENNREPCKVCGNTPDITGTIKHGRECYVVSEGNA